MDRSTVKAFLKELELISNRYGISVAPESKTWVELVAMPSNKRARYDWDDQGSRAVLVTHVDDYHNPLAARPPVRIGMPVFVPHESMRGIVVAMNGPDVWINLECDPPRRIRAKISELRPVSEPEIGHGGPCNCEACRKLRGGAYVATELKPRTQSA